MLAQLCIEFQNLVLILEMQALYALSTLRLSSILFTVQSPRLRKALLPRESHPASTKWLFPKHGLFPAMPGSLHKWRDHFHTAICHQQLTNQLFLDVCNSPSGCWSRARALMQRAGPGSWGGVWRGQHNLRQRKALSSLLIHRD